MKSRTRFKSCSRCGQTADVLYRVQAQPGDWSFVCPSCWPSISQNNPHYVYGGTWKAKKRS